MSYETTKIVQTLRFPGDTTTQYQINAVALGGHSWGDIEERFGALESFDALTYKGTIAGGSTIPGGLTVAADKGDVYKVTTDGYVMGAKVEVGDMLICNTDDTAAATSTNYTTIAANWDIIQSNIDVESILDHTHTGTVDLVKTSKTLEHTITPSKANITASYSGGTATVEGDHTHTASGSVQITPGGTVENKSVTPKGTVKLTTPTTAGTNDATITPSGTVANSAKSYVESVSIENHAAHTHGGTTNSGKASITGSVTIKTGTGTANYTPGGSIGNATTVTSVEGGATTVSSHVVTETSAGGHTPAGTVTVDNATATGTVASHKHNVTTTTTPGAFISGATFTAGSTSYDGTLTFTSSNAVTSVSTTEESIAPTFTGTAHKHTATFAGTAVGGHKHSVSVADHDSFIPVINVVSNPHTHTFSGTGVQLVTTHNLTDSGHTHGFTTAANTTGMDHTVTAPTSAHNHGFTGNNQYVHAAFTGTAESHNHSFTGADATHSVTVTVDKFDGNFTGSSTGSVGISVTPNANGDVLTGVSISNHSISTVDSASVTTGKGQQ